MLDRIRILREIHGRCEARQPLSDRQLEWLSAALSNFLEHRCTSIDAAFGLSGPRGGVPWWIEEGIRKRNLALRRLADRCCAGLTANAQAEHIWQISNRYAASAWRFDQGRDEMPSYYANTPKEQLWCAFKSGATMPLGKRQLRAVLSGLDHGSCAANTLSKIRSR